MAYNQPIYIGSQPTRPTVPAVPAGPNPTDTEYAQDTFDVVDYYKTGNATDADLASATNFMPQVGNEPLQPNDLQDDDDTPAWANQLIDQAIRIEGKLIRLEINFARAYNGSCGDGKSHPWVVVCNKNGVVPTRPPHNLPVLLDYNDISGLSNVETNSYITFYQINVPARSSYNLKKTELARFLGTVGVTF